MVEKISKKTELVVSMRYKSFTHISFNRFSLLVAASIMLASLVASCTSFGKSEATFEGLFVSSFEASIFYPCSMGIQIEEMIEAQGSKDLGYWLTSRSDSGFNEQLTEFAALEEPTGLRMYVKFTGVRSPTKPFGGYGHLGMYKDEVTVIKILEMKPWSDGLC
jgi:hypothetical protein